MLWKHDRVMAICCFIQSLDTLSRLAVAIQVSICL
ncbi:hypothetical protein ESCOCK434M_25110 [Escherichia coli]